MCISRLDGKPANKNRDQDNCRQNYDASCVIAFSIISMIDFHPNADFFANSGGNGENEPPQKISAHRPGGIQDNIVNIGASRTKKLQHFDEQ
ncbi:hypothetical protein SDC9_169193 [bioreactor metagenome]|uniref:Uncharacterized protein n=1 Tax=bioreactor metagenome TaxID=1076179 RepID=A0A645G4L6_9ZZZZ